MPKKPRVKPDQLLAHDRVALELERWKGAIEEMETLFEDWHYHATRLLLTPCRGWCDTAAVDGVHLFINPEFSSGLSDKELLFVAVHEVFHVANGHLWRTPQFIMEETNLQKRARLLKKWNYATDYSIHQVLKPLSDDEMKDDISMPVDALYDVKYDGLSAEVIYDMLDENFDGGPRMDIHILIGKAGGDGSMPAGAKDLGNGNYVLVTDGNGEPMDIPGNDLNNPAPDGLTEGEFMARCQEIAEEIQNNCRGHGTGNEHRSLTVPPDPKDNREDWYTELINFMLKRAKSDFSYSRPNRGYLVRNNIWAPSLHSELLEGVIAIDVSGSISDKIYRQFVTRIEAMRGQIPTHNLKLIFCDADIKRIDEIYAGTAINWTIPGRGGTDFRPVFDYVEKNALNPAFLIYFTDAEGEFPKYEPNYPVLWCVWGNTNWNRTRGNRERISDNKRATPWGHEIRLNKVNSAGVLMGPEEAEF